MIDAEIELGSLVIFSAKTLAYALDTRYTDDVTRAGILKDDYKIFDIGSTALYMGVIQRHSGKIKFMAVYDKNMYYVALSGKTSVNDYCEIISY